MAPTPAGRETPISTFGPSRKSAPGVTLPSGVDLDAVMRQVHFAFRPEDDSLVGGHQTYVVREREGRVALRAHHASAGRRSPIQRKSDGGGELALRTYAVTRDGESLLDPRIASRVGAAGQLEIVRGGVVETWTNRDEGSEQAWRVSERPAGDGDLVVEVAATGLDYVGTSEAGLHFADASGLGFRYGHATWVDANGARTQVPASFDRGRIVLRVPARVVDASTYPTVLDPLVGPEIGMDAPVRGVAARGDQANPAIAFDGTNYLVVWNDERDEWIWNEHTIYGARVSPSGTVLDPVGIPIGGRFPFPDFPPAVAFDGTNYLVVWTDDSSSALDIYGARVSTSGLVLDPSGFPVTEAPNAQMFAAVAFDGTNYLVVWKDERSGTSTDIYGARISTAGTVLDPSAFLVSPANSFQSSPSIAFDGANYLVVWDDYPGSSYANLYGARVSPNAAVVDTPAFLVASTMGWQITPRLAFDGTNFLVVWPDAGHGASFDIFATRVSTAGAILDATPFQIDSPTVTSVDPAVAFDGTNYLIVWGEYHAGTSSDVHGARVNTAGTLLDPQGFVVTDAAADQTRPAVAFDGTNFLVAWGGGWFSASSDVDAARVSTSGTTIDTPGFLVSTATNRQLAPDVAFDGTNYFVVWMDDRNANFDLYGVRIDRSGTVLDASGILVNGGATDQVYPALAFDGTNYLVVWEDVPWGAYSDIHGTRVSPDGTVIDADGFVVSAAPNWQDGPEVAFDGTNYLAVWTDMRTSSTTANVYGARVTTAGTVLDTNGFVISSPSVSAFSPAISFDGTNYLVVWSDRRNNASSTDVYGARVDTSGTVVDASGIVISAAPNSQGNPKVAFDGTNSLVVWWDLRNGGTGDLYGARVDSTGSVLDASGIVVATPSGTVGPYAVAFDGTEYLVVWSDRRSGTSAEVYGARLTPLGIVLDADGFGVSNSGSADEYVTAIASDGVGGALVVYEAPLAQADGAERALARTLLRCGPADSICAGGGGTPADTGGVRYRSTYGCSVGDGGTTSMRSAWWLMLAGLLVANRTRRRRRLAQRA